jgi:hypothetical protein
MKYQLRLPVSGGSVKNQPDRFRKNSLQAVNYIRIVRRLVKLRTYPKLKIK